MGDAATGTGEVTSYTAARGPLKIAGRRELPGAVLVTIRYREIFLKTARSSGQSVVRAALGLRRSTVTLHYHAVTIADVLSEIVECCRVPCSSLTNLGKPSGSARHGSHLGSDPANREGNAGVNPLVGAYPPLIMRFCD